MKREDFKLLIESIGFKHNNGYYIFKEFKIYLYYSIQYDFFQYDFYNGSEWVLGISLNDLTPLENNFKNELRSYKLKVLLR